MKNYQKPNFDIIALTQSENIAGLSNWLENGEGQEFSEAGITTYVIVS